jgi:hypothetical protein
MATTLTLPPLRPEIATYPIEHSHPPTDAAESSAPSQPGKHVPQTQSDSTSQSVAALHDQLHASHLTSSPYPEIENQLHLQDLDTPHKLFALALTTLRPIRDDYATAPYLESFNWSDVFATLRELCRLVGQNWPELGFYIVIFRSRLHAGIDRERLGLLDRKSHAEACASGGLLKYWFGSCDAERRNLATCEWWTHSLHREGESCVYGLLAD